MRQCSKFGGIGRNFLGLFLRKNFSQELLGLRSMPKRHFTCQFGYVYIKSTLHSWTESIMTSTKRTSSRPPGLQIGNYQLRETIGIGAFGKVKGSYYNIFIVIGSPRIPEQAKKI
jgi:hypothetical protein